VNRPKLPALILAVVAGVAPGRAGAAEPATGGVGVLSSAVTAKAVVIGRFSQPTRLDLHGRAAELRVDQTLRGHLQAGATLRVAWEELSQARPDRFADGQRVLLCLEPLPTQSLWRKRFPDPGDQRRAMVVAAGGRAFVREPGAETSHALQHYLAMAPSARSGGAGHPYLVDLVATAEPGLAGDALAHLAADDELNRRLPAASAIVLARVAGKKDRPVELRRNVLDVIGKREVAAARPVVADLAGRPDTDTDIDATALLALARLDDGLPPDQVEQLLTDERAALRAVAARFVAGEDTQERLARLVQNDPAPEVRLAAVSTLLERDGVDAVQATLPALADTDSTVRSEAARKIGTLGEPVVPSLKAVVDGTSRRSAEGAVVALSFAGAGGLAAIREIAHSHPDEKIRNLAGLALGQAPGHTHGD